MPGLSGVSGADAGPIKLDWPGEMRKWMGKGKERWDFPAAGACLLVGLVMGLGVVKSAGLLLVLALVVGSYVWYHGTPTSSPSLSANFTETPKDQTLSSLTTFLAQSDSLNATMMSSLEILQPDSEPEDNPYELRLALHRLTDNMTDHIATATSTLLKMTDRNELGVLGEMYDIPVVGSSFYSRRRANESLSNDSEQADQTVSSPRSTPIRPLSTPSPSRIFPPGSLRRYGHSGRSQHMSIMSMPDPNDRFTQIPERTPRLSKRASQERIATRKSWNPENIRHERRIMEADEDADNSFVSAQSSEEGDKTLVQALRNSLSPDPNTSPELSMSTPTTPITPITKRRPISSSFKHIPSPLARRLSQVSETGLIPLRTAPLAYRSRTNSSSLLPSPFETDFPSSPIRPTESSARALGLSDDDLGRKRRSLQNMPYYPSSENDHLPGADLARTRSMPISDLQTLRSAQSTGSRARQSSVNRDLRSVDIGLGLPDGFPPNQRSSFASVSSPLSRTALKRINSVSPLTTPALTASSLGIHLKRRRMACCLLGLRFEEPNGMYWDEVNSTLEELSRKIKEEREVVEDVLRKVRKDMAIKETLDNLVGGRSGFSDMGISTVEAIFPFPTTLNDQQRDFAPKTSDQRLLVEHIDKMSSSIVKVWGELANLRSTLGREGEGETSERWAKVRESVGEVIREWERGREVSNRMDEHCQEETLGNNEVGEESEEAQEPKMPDFLRAWEDTSRSRSTSPETDRQSFINKIHLAEHPSISPHHDESSLVLDQLPLPGKDTVFESVSAPLPRAKTILNGMTREERIKVMREARAKGVNIEDLLGVTELGKDEDARKRGGELVSELEGVIDVIRKMKEPEFEGEYRKTVKTDAQTEQPSLASPFISSISAPMTPSLTPSSGPHLSNPHLQFDLGELKRSFRFPAAGEGGDDHVLG